jgi:hypothetical protein
MVGEVEGVVHCVLLMWSDRLLRLGGGDGVCICEVAVRSVRKRTELRR